MCVNYFMDYKFLRLVPIGFTISPLPESCTRKQWWLLGAHLSASISRWESEWVRGVYILNILKIFKYLQHRPFLRLEAQDTSTRRALRHTIFSSLAVEHLHQNGLQPAKSYGLNLVNKVHQNTTWHILPTLQPNHSHPQGGNLVTLSIGLLHLQRRRKFERTSPQHPRLLNLEST